MTEEAWKKLAKENSRDDEKEPDRYSQCVQGSESSSDCAEKCSK